MNSTYFKNLYALRFIGAFSVILGHIELIKSMENMPNLMHLPFYKYTNGHVGVLLFFVLSGFLITFFLIEELKKGNRINFKIFYLKRLFRIWPIYYLMIIFSVLFLPYFLNSIDGTIENIDFKDTYFYWLFLPNLGKSAKCFVQGATHLWSIGVEEQFYLIWPVLLAIFRKHLFLILIITIFVFSLTTPFIDFIDVHTSFFKNNIETKNFLSSFFSGFKINSMAVGGIFSYFCHSNHKLINILKNDFIEILLILSISYFWISGTTFGTYSDEVYSLFFGIAIYLLATREKSFFNLENKIAIFFGKISYGLYVYHWAIILVLIKIIKTNKTTFHLETINNIILYSSSLLLTILISYLSYIFIEKPIMNQIKKFN